MEKESQDTMSPPPPLPPFPCAHTHNLCDYQNLRDYQAKLHLLFVSATADQFRSHKERAGHCSMADHLKQETVVPDIKAVASTVIPKNAIKLSQLD